MNRIPDDEVAILQHPEAQALLQDAVVDAADVRGCARRLTGFLAEYLPLFGRSENREHAAVAVRGRLGGLERKTCEPIANAAGVHRRQIQDFVGAGRWDDEAVMAAVRDHVGRELADPGAVLVFDGSAFAKCGAESCGVKRQWNGRLGKIDNCQVGVFATYAAAGGHAPVHRRLFLPQDWAADPERREKTHVPEEVVHQEKWRIALDQLEECSQLPHAWVAADDEFGRSAEFRAQLRERGEGYVLDVPCNTLIRDLEKRRPPRRKGRRGRRRENPFVRADTWTRAQPADRWVRLTVRAGESGPLLVDAMQVRVAAKQDGRVGPEERLVAIRTVGAETKTSYCMSNAGPATPLAEPVRAHSERNRVEQTVQEGKGEVGLAQYEVRSWTGWHHHMTLSLLALWFLVTERRATGKKNPGGHGAAVASDHDGAASPAAAHLWRDRRARERRVASDGGGPHLQMA